MFGITIMLTKIEEGQKENDVDTEDAETCYITQKSHELYIVWGGYCSAILALFFLDFLKDV